MTIENPISNTSEGKKKALFNIVETKIKSHIHDVRKENESGPNILLKALDILIRRIKKVIPDKEKELSEIFNLFTQNPIEDEKEFIRSVSESISDFMASNYTPEEMEEIERRGTRYNNLILNRLVEYSVTGNVLHIHIPLTFVDNPMELRTLFLDGVQELANKLKNDPELASIEKIMATSWIVVKAQRALKDFGFTIINVNKEDNMGTAEISREKLIEMYGK